MLAPSSLKLNKFDLFRFFFMKNSSFNNDFFPATTSVVAHFVTMFFYYAYSPHNPPPPLPDISPSGYKPIQSCTYKVAIYGGTQFHPT